MKALQSDNGREYCNAEMDKVLKTNGIRRRLTVTYSPEQNGVAERRNRTLVEAAGCSLIQSGLPPSFWAEAIMAANYVRNRCISSSLDGKTLFQLWTGKLPDVSNLRSFGCKAFVLDKFPNRDKLGPKALKGVFVGYPEEAKGYRVWIPAERKIQIARDIKFFNEYYSSEQSEDFVSNLTYSGRFPVLDVSPKMASIGPNKSNVKLEEVTSDQECRAHEKNTSPENEPPPPSDTPLMKRGPGRPKKVKTGKKGRPSKQYHIVEVDASEQRETTCPGEDASNDSDDPED